MFLIGVEAVCAIDEPLVKVLHLVGGDNPTMLYLYKARRAMLGKLGFYWKGRSVDYKHTEKETNPRKGV